MASRVDLEWDEAMLAENPGLEEMVPPRAEWETFKLGKLLRHKLWKLAKKRVVSHPAELRVVSKSTKETPLHTAVAKGAPASLLELMLAAHPSAAKRKERFGLLPHHCAVGRHSTPEQLLLLTSAYPEGLRELVSLKGRGKPTSTILHLATSNSASFEIIEMLLSVVPDMALAEDDAGNMPLHTALLHKSTTRIVRLLMVTAPSALRKTNKSMQLPLHIAVSTNCAPSTLRVLADGYPNAMGGRFRGFYKPRLSKPVRTLFTEVRAAIGAFLLDGGQRAGYNYWACPSCTFRNPAHNVCCSMCRTSCPPGCLPEAGLAEQAVSDREARAAADAMEPLLMAADDGGAAHGAAAGGAEGEGMEEKVAEDVEAAEEQQMEVELPPADSGWAAIEVSALEDDDDDWAEVDFPAPAPPAEGVVVEPVPLQNDCVVEEVLSDELFGGEMVLLAIDSAAADAATRERIGEVAAALTPTVECEADAVVAAVADESDESAVAGGGGSGVGGDAIDDDEAASIALARALMEEDRMAAAARAAARDRAAHAAPAAAPAGRRARGEDEGASSVCTICKRRPKNGVIVHGNIGHRVACYSCARALRVGCPACSMPIDTVYKWGQKPRGKSYRTRKITVFEM
eukprot:PLAT10391.1.p1 GENE.PLAT10391.1~~PLAT10391.1.p1  ORF type:complete len:628 (+),score=252.94 PLAT10391.1:141-2024(+)